MRVSFRLLFVGWWMAGQRWLVTGQTYPKPAVSVSPEVVTLGGNVIVHCSRANQQGAEFSLIKSNSSLPPLLPQTTKDYHAEFNLSITSISDAGIYLCLYHFGSGPDIQYSDYSDAVHISVTDPGIPKPSIKVKPRRQNVLGSNVTLECWGQRSDLNFFLHKANKGETSKVAAAQTEGKAIFSFPQVRREDAGRYTCQYHYEGIPFVWSEPSDPVELILKDPDFFKPSIKVRPEGPHDIGAEVTIECKGQDSGLTFVLHKSKNLTVLQPMKAEGNTAKFSLSPVRQEDAGNYTCQYYHEENPFVRSEPSKPARIVVTGMSTKTLMTIIWASAAAGLLLVLFFLVLILLSYKKRRKRSAAKGGNQPVNTLLKRNAGTGQDNRADHDGVTYAVLNHHKSKTEQPSSQPTGFESCVYASVAKERS